MHTLFNVINCWCTPCTFTRRTYHMVYHTCTVLYVPYIGTDFADNDSCLPVKNKVVTLV